MYVVLLFLASCLQVEFATFYIIYPYIDRLSCHEYKTFAYSVLYVKSVKLEIQLLSRYETAIVQVINN